MTARELNESIGREVIRYEGTIPVVNGIYEMTDDPNIDEESESPEWIGYDSIAEGYVRRTHSPYFGAEIARAALATGSGDEAVVLDVGAGTGCWTIPFAQAGAKVIAVDISSRMLGILMSAIEEICIAVHACRANALHLPVAGSSVDFVVVSELFHLVREPERIVREIQRVLRPGGALMRPHCQGGEELDGDTAEESERCWSIWSTVYKRHHELATQQGLVHTPRPGWWGDKQHDNMVRLFSRFTEVTVPGAIKDEVRTLREYFDDLRGRGAYSDKVRFDPEVNAAIVGELAREIEDQHGLAVWDLRHTTRSVYCARLYYV